MFGLMLIAVNFLYLVFSLIVGIVTYVFLSKKEKFTKPKRFGISVGTFLVVWMLPFWDLLLQKGIKTYYETFMMESQIYAYPEKDKDGKIESLGVGENVVRTTVSYLEDQKSLSELKEHYLVKGFIEYYFFDSFEKSVDKDGKVIIKDNYKKDFGYARVYLNKTPMCYENIKDESEYIARYQVIGRDDSGLFYNKTIIEFWDMKEHKLLAEGFKLDFETKNYNQKFRNKYLLFRGPSGNSLTIGWLETYRNIFKKIFNVTVY